MLRKLFILIALSLCSAITNASGFGIQMGKSPSEYGCQAVTGSTGVYYCDAPKPHSAFENYAVRASDKHGICWVKGIGKDVADNGYGSSTKLKHSELQGALSKAYGEISETSDFIIPGALWDDADEWLMSIKQNQRVYSVAWQNLEMPGKPKLNQIYLGVNATGSSEGYLALEYYAKFYEECKTAIVDSESSAL